MADLSYTLGLDSAGFMSSAGRAISLMGSMELAMQGMERAARALGSSFNEAASMERTATAIGTITKSAQVTEQVMSDLRDLAKDTPFEMTELAPAARALLGAGTAAGTVSDQLRMLGDVAAGADTDLGGLVSVFNQVRGKGKLTAEEFQQFAERGVAGLREEIAKFKGISVENVADALTRGLVSAKDLEGVFQRMTSSGGIAFQAMERQAQTFTGKLSTLSDAWTELQVAFAAPINDALKPVVDDITSLAEAMTPAFEVLGNEAAALVTATREFVLQLGEGPGLVDNLVSSFGQLADSVAELVSIPFGAMMDAMPDLMSAVAQAAGPMAEYFSLKLDVVADRFGSRLQSKTAELLRGLDEVMPDFGLLSAMSSVFDAQAMKNATAAMHTEDTMKAIDLNSGLQGAEDSLNSAMQALLDGMVARYDSFMSGHGASSASVDAIAEAVSASFLDRLAAAAATPTMLTVPASTPANAPAGSLQSEAALNRLDAILGELNRLRTE